MTSVEPTSNKAETSYTLAEPETAASGAKQGHKCCGGCCDVRRAVIVVNIVNASVIGLFMLSSLATRNSINVDLYDDDEMAAVVQEYKNQPIGTAMAIMGARILASICGIAGGVKFHVPLTCVAALAYAIYVVMDLIQFNVGGLILQGFFLYPHVFFIQEMRKGIMTETNYPIEKQSCCCV